MRPTEKKFSGLTVLYCKTKPELTSFYYGETRRMNAAFILGIVHG